MFRILGFILGSAVSIAAIFMVLGVPEIRLPSAEADQARFDAALQKIREMIIPLDMETHITIPVLTAGKT